MNEKLEAWGKVLDVSFDQIEAYNLYIENKSAFMTHQGVKGLEFPRIMAVIDDNDARGFMFSYDKLFRVKEKTAADIKNEMEEKDNTFDRTRRLFYVICSRAEKSLAIVAYSGDPERVKKSAIEEGWFEDGEIVLL